MKTPLDAITKTQIERRLDLAASWIAKSIRVCDGNGSASWFHLLRGWHGAYPETSGYLLPTLLAYGEHKADPDWRKRAERIADWLLTRQLPEGGFGSIGKPDAPLVFDTGQILLGFIALLQVDPQDSLQRGSLQALSWLKNTMDEPQSWENASYHSTIPAYHTRVVWPMLVAERVLNGNVDDAFYRDLIGFLLRNLDSEFWTPDYAFQLGVPAFTHTIAYTVRGLIESAIILCDDLLLNTAKSILDRIVMRINAEGQLAGSYSQGWAGDTSFICIPGHLQLGLCYLRLGKEMQLNSYQEVAWSLYTQVSQLQFKLPVASLRGGVAGSSPLWGKYQKFQLTNWGAKFFCDLSLALLRAHPISQ